MTSTYDQLLAQGRTEGRTEGIAEGSARLFLAQLEARFGALGDTIRQRVLAAGVEQLESWAIRLLDAPDLTSVFDDPAGGGEANGA